MYFLNTLVLFFFFNVFNTKTINESGRENELVLLSSETKEVVPKINECGVTGVNGTFSNTTFPSSPIQCTKDMSKKCCYVSGDDDSFVCLSTGSDIFQEKKRAEEVLLKKYSTTKVVCGSEHLPTNNTCGKTRNGGLDKETPPKDPTFCYFDVDNKCCYVERRGLNGQKACISYESDKIEISRDAEEIMRNKYGENLKLVQCGPTADKAPEISSCGKKDLIPSSKEDCSDPNTICCLLDIKTKKICLTYGEPGDFTKNAENDIKDRYLYNINSVQCNPSSSSNYLHGFGFGIGLLILLNLI
jgi:hypothetical protein